ncbi:sigma-54-dependent transcriptional regulator [Bacteroidota bacterium]
MQNTFNKQKGNILLVDDDKYIVLSLKTLLEQHYSLVMAINDPKQIPKILESHNFDVIFLDMNFTTGATGGAEGFEWLKNILKIDPDSNVILITAYGEIGIAVKAMKMGAIDFIVKPWENEKLLATVSTAMQLSRSKQKVSQLESQQEILNSNINFQYSEIIGQSPAMQKVFDSIEKLAVTDANILILGDNGTGKELVARAIHRSSNRSDEVFISVDLGAISESLFESELFGHVKGAYTDAKEDRTGRFEAASGGTIFLDEIGNLSLSLQAKLLTVLQNRKITKLGSNREMDIDIRLLCASNMPLKEMVKEGKFRQDLLYRINTIEMYLPSLAERREDIPLLAKYFIKIYSRKYKKEKLFISDNVFKKLKNAAWPGNVRELQHSIERAVIMSDGKNLSPSDFSIITDDNVAIDSGSGYNLYELEKIAILKCLQKHSGHLTKAAKDLGLTRGSLYRRLEKYGI